MKQKTALDILGTPEAVEDLAMIIDHYNGDPRKIADDIAARGYLKRRSDIVLEPEAEKVLDAVEKLTTSSGKVIGGEAVIEAMEAWKQARREKHAASRSIHVGDLTPGRLFRIGGNQHLLRVVDVVPAGTNQVGLVYFNLYTAKYSVDLLSSRALVMAVQDA